MKQVQIATGQQTNGKRSFEGDGHIDRSENKTARHCRNFNYSGHYRTNADGNDSDTTIASDKTIAYSPSAIKKPLAHARASLASTSALAVKDDVPPPRASTIDESATQRNNTDPGLAPADQKTLPKLIIKNVTVREGQMLFRVGFDSSVWLHYDQVKDSYCVQLFLKELTDSEWKKFILERETRVIEAGSLALGACGEEMAVDQVILMKSWGGRWMFEIEATTVELDLRDVERMGLVDDAVRVCREKHGGRNLSVYY